MMDSVAQQIREHLEKTYAWVNGGELERMIFYTLKGKPAKPSNISKRLRELSADKIIDKQLRDGSIWYHGKNKITLPAPFPVKKEQQNRLI